MTPDIDIRIDRFVNRKLHPAAARAMAHEALDDADLFEELTAVAVAQASLESASTTDRALAQSALDDPDLFDTLVARGAIEAAVRTPFRSKRPAILVAAAIAVAAGLLTFFVLRPASHSVQPPAPQARSVVTTPAVAPTILLTTDLQPARSRNAPVFRGDVRGGDARGGDAASRPPRSDGAIVSIEDDVATVNLGSLDGLSKGTELLAGRIVITTVFRDHARGDISEGEMVHTGDPVRVPNQAHIAAILQQADALAANGDLKAAREVARNAIAGGPSGETRPLLERLAALDYRAGAPDAARERYEVAVNNFDQPPAAGSREQAATLANYGALLLVNGDRDRAGELLQKALAQAPAPALRSQILNNLGAVAELGGDQAKAADYYNQALAQNTSKADRTVESTNLARVGKHPLAGEHK
jgi:Tfp pilus assembly protein PilF